MQGLKIVSLHIRSVFGG